MANPPSLPTDDSIQTTISSETVEMTIVVVAEAEIVITTVITTRIPISPAIVIVIQMPRSRTLYTRN